MELFELKKQIKTNQLNSFYIFTGEEVAIMDIYIEQIAGTANAKVKRVDSIGDIYSKLQNNSFIKQPICYIVRDDKDYLSQDKVWDSIIDGAVLGQNLLILVYSSIDKRSKFYKHHEDILVTFDLLSPEILCKYISKEINLIEPYRLQLASLCDCNYSRILLECDKIRHLANAAGCQPDEAFERMRECKLIYSSPKDVIFDLVDAVCKRRAQESFDLLYQVNEYKDSTLGIISLLYTNIKSILLVQTAGQCESITDRTGLTAWQVKLAKEKGVHYDTQELVKALRLIREAEKGIKTGTLDPTIAVEYILVNLL